jgi:toxin ParE1/3/4
MPYVADRNPAAAIGQLAEIQNQVRNLIAHPLSGRPGRVAHTRELIVSRTPFIVICAVGNAVELLRILHGAQQWPIEPERRDGPHTHLHPPVRSSPLR